MLFEKYFRLKYKAMFTNTVITGISTSGSIMVSAASELIPNTAIATKLANSKSLLPL